MSQSTQRSSNQLVLRLQALAEARTRKERDSAYRKFSEFMNHNNDKPPEAKKFAFAAAKIAKTQGRQIIIPKGDTSYISWELKPENGKISW